MAKAKGLEGVHGLVTPEEAVSRVAAAAGGRAPARRSGARAAPEAERFDVTTFRVRRAHLVALKEEARLRAGATKRPDASEVLREVLDAWLDRRR